VAEPSGVTRVLLAIARDLRDDHALAEQICRACVAGLDIDGAAISLHTASTLRETLFATDATADLLEDLQFSLGEGACIEASRTGRPVLVPDMADTADTSRWPIYAGAVLAQANVRAIFALPLQWGTINLGVLTDLTGVFAALGKDITNANTMFWKDNKVCDTYDVKLNVQDTGYVPQTGARGFAS